MRQAQVLATNINVVADQPALPWVGGRTALTLIAGTFPTTLKLQLLGPDNSTWIDINASTFSANGAYIFDLPQGQYRLHLTGGTVAGLYAVLSSIVYT